MTTKWAQSALGNEECATLKDLATKMPWDQHSHASCTRLNGQIRYLRNNVLAPAVQTRLPPLAVFIHGLDCFALVAATGELSWLSDRGLGIAGWCVSWVRGDFEERRPIQVSW
jgi:hypothetical protein